MSILKDLVVATGNLWILPKQLENHLSPRLISETIDKVKKISKLFNFDNEFYWFQDRTSRFIFKKVRKQSKRTLYVTLLKILHIYKRPWLCQTTPYSIFSTLQSTQNPETSQPCKELKNPTPHATHYLLDLIPSF